MSKPYPSRRELRLQREREERAHLRDQEAQRWAEEVEDREQRVAGAERQAQETLAGVEPVPASQPHETPTGGRRAATTPVDTAVETDDPETSAAVAPRRRRADSQVTSTGMLPVITKRRDHQQDAKPRSRREARAQAQQGADVEAPNTSPTQQRDTPLKPIRRATSPQAPPPPVPAYNVDTTQDERPDNEIVVSTSDHYGESAVEITDMSGLDTLEIRRAELREETELLTQEIIELGQQNPNVIDPLLLRRQKELAEKSQELQNLETAAVDIVEDEQQQDQQEPDVIDAPEEGEGDVTSDTSEGSSDDVEPEMTAAQDTQDTAPIRRARRASSGPVITGPFAVSEHDDAVDSARTDVKPDFSEHFEPEPETDAVPVTGPEQPLEARSAHGLDTLDPKESEAPERLILTISLAVFAVGIIALLIALILLTR